MAYFREKDCPVPSVKVRTKVKARIVSYEEKRASFPQVLLPSLYVKSDK